jgi:hypothetical protein
MWLLEVLRTIQAPDFQYFVDLKALINKFFTQANIYVQNTVLDFLAQARGLHHGS